MSKYFHFCLLFFPHFIFKKESNRKKLCTLHKHTKLTTTTKKKEKNEEIYKTTNNHTQCQMRIKEHVKRHFYEEKKKSNLSSSYFDGFIQMLQFQKPKKLA